ncbi:YLP motif-containing protein 1 isoform X1 [Anopheles stephensi]|uniref:YLP motif-containing protein 1 isoform X1 n=1 Tax=Anopheles stephensi TaxID=30069 RepID=UPI0016589921|nr:YLP motif-containing protein 1 isoform X1 [Anopheles stephensi]
MRLFVLAIAALVVLHGYVESKNVTNPTVKSSPTTKSASTPTTVSTKKPSPTETKQPGSDREARGKRTLEFGNYANYNRYQSVPAHTVQRRVSHAYQDPGQYSHFQSNYIQPQYSYQHHHSAPSGPGPVGSYQGFDGDSSNSIGSFQSLPPVVHPHYIEPPEPIIEIIIKESNDSLPLDAQTILPKQKKKKEEVQVFYVKYHKDEKNGQLVLDDPLPAIKPIPDESEEEEDLSQEPIIVTPSPPLKTTTLRAVINPDSEKYHSNSGIRISFGVEDKHQSGHQLSETESESVAQPIVALPQHLVDQRSKSDVFYQQHQQFVQQHHDRSVRQHYQQQPQPQQPQQHGPQQYHHQQFNAPVQQHQYHHQPPPQAQPLVQQHQEQQNFGQRFAPATPQPYRAQPPPPPPPPPQPQPQFQQHQQHQQHFQQQQQHQQQHQQHFQPQPQPQPQPQQPRVVYQQAQPQQQHSQQPFQYRGQFNQQQQQPQPQYFNQPAPVPQPRPQQVRFPPPQQQQQPQPNFYQPQPQQPQPSPPQQQPQFQRQEYQQPKPIPIPLHNINQQPPLRQQYSTQQLQAQPAQPPKPQPQFNQPFNNFYKQQPQSAPQPQIQQQQQFRKPLPPPPSNLQQPPFLAARPQSPVQQQPTFQNERPNVDVRTNFFDVPRPVQGGLVQQAAPNLGPTRAPDQLKGAAPHSSLSDNEHLANLKHVLPAGGELVPSVSKYEKHITETVNGPTSGLRLTASGNDPSNRPPFYNIQPSQELISHSIEPTIETVQNKNIGPLVSNIGPLPTPQKYVSQQAAQIIPNSEPVNYRVDPRFNSNFQGGAPTAQGPSSTPSTVGTTRTTYSPTFSTTPRTTVGRYTAPPSPTTTPYRTTRPPTTTTTTPAPRSAAEEAAANEKKQKALFELPDEVPDDLREQLLSSGILENADISVLDYDKIGETALENLPPEHLANFFNAGGGSQLAGSNNVLSVLKPNGDKLAEKFITKNYDVKDKRDERDRYEIAQPSQTEGESVAQAEEDQPTIVTMPERQNVDLKVVRFDSNNQRNVTDRYIKQDSTILPSVDVTGEDESGATDQVFNRYLPLKINGAQFPIPDVAELRGRKIASVVVLAPVDNGPTAAAGKNGESGSEEGGSSSGFLINAEDDATDEQQQDQQQSRFERDVLLDSKKIKFIAGEALKQLIKKPSRENFRRWLEREGKTDVDLQSVVLLVTRNDDDEQEIFMYDIATKGVTHLSGELSAAFVQVAEENAKTQNFDEVPIVDSGIVEQMETKSSSESSPDYGAGSYALTSSEEQDDQAQASERKAIYVYPENYRGLEVNSGYSNIKK